MKLFISAIIFTIFFAHSGARVITKRQINPFQQGGFGPGFGQPVFYPGQFPGQFQGPFGGQQFPNQQGQRFPNQGQQFPNQQGQQFPNQGQQFPNQQGQQGQQFPNQGQQFPNQQGQQFPNQQGQQFPNQQGQQGQQFPSQQTQQSTTLSPQVQNCVERCIETTQGSYNPVCGSDNQTYHNKERFDCANECGANLRMLSNGACPSRNATTNRPT